MRDAILARTTDLDAEAWDLLHLLACAPEAIPDHLLAALGIGLPPLRALDQAGLIRRGPAGVAFRHDLCRLAIASTIPPGGEAALHRRMLDALEASAVADPAVLAHHAIGAGDAARILRYAADAGAPRPGRARTRRRPRSSASRSSAARSLTPTEQAELLEPLAEECYLIDRLDDAIAASERAMRLRERAGDSAGVSANHHALAVYHWYNADRQRRRAPRRPRRSPCSTATPPAASGRSSPLGHALAMQAYLALQASDLDARRWLHPTAAELGARSRRPDAVRAHRADRRHLRRARAATASGRDAMLSILGAADDDFDEIYSSGYSNLTYLDVEQRRLAEAAELLDISLPLTVERDLPICRVWQLGSRGRLQAARRRLGRGRSPTPTPCSPARARRSPAPGPTSSRAGRDEPRRGAATSAPAARSGPSSTSSASAAGLHPVAGEHLAADRASRAATRGRSAARARSSAAG